MVLNLEDRKGQFYLIAALIIITIIVGFVSISNFAKTGSEARIYDVQEELGIESGAVLDYGIYSGGDTNSLLGDFSDQYAEYAGEGRELIFVYGNVDELVVRTYRDVITGTIGIGFEEGGSNYDIESKYRDEETLTPDNPNVVVSFNEREYYFELSRGQNFYFVISEESAGGEYVASN